ncbi:AAA family ATPase [Haloplanus rubicundus]|uniref:AAA family ATPase n=1 Tax=Haloplanus rubicundus TaxID=1547898 RepID=A0A345E461_9EURY|nr:AAA family ATPase [Haloplanus rubicundus]AXG06983.1 AAA family ATPase [Haloplanus rubicundus]
MTYDGPRIFLAPYGNDVAYENFNRTVIQGISANQYGIDQNYCASDRTAHLWGTKGTIRGSWSDIEPGDFLIFYRDSEYTHAAEVIATEENESRGKAVWPNYEEGAPWLCIIYLDEPVDLGVDSSEIHGLAGYDIDYPMGFSPLNELGIGGIRGKYGSVESFVYGDPGSSPDASEVPKISVPGSILDGLHFPDSSDTTVEDIVDQTQAALNAGKHVIFTGPPGTGKTEIAQRVARHLCSEHPNVYSGHQTTTATADWSTFDTVGGYMPEGTGDSLDFSAGQILRCFKQDESQRNDLLIIDEINRSDIDKSFGQLFTLLSGQRIQLPFTREGEAVEVTPAANWTGSLEPHQYVVPDSWRILATMNSYDKTSLYEMSYAFMRRFAFIYIAAPTVPSDDTDRRQMINEYASEWELDVERAVTEAIGDVWYVTNTSVDNRKIGPAIIMDMLSHVSNSTAPVTTAVTQAVASYVFPQLEGVRGREQVVAELSAVESVDESRLSHLAEDILQVKLDG